MAAYLIAEVEITDPDGYEEYRRLVPSSIAQYGGTYLVRGGKVDVLEGDWDPKRLVILEFESAERARAWWVSEEYRDAKQIRQRTATSRMIVVEGV